MCRAAIMIFLGAYALAVFIFLVGTFGWFGQDRDPLSGVFLIPLGLPWNLLFDSVSDNAKPSLAIASPVVNVAILMVFCRRFRPK